MATLKIISGGQTGADRAALDFAMAHNIPHGGWCPRGRVAEDGTIPARYLLLETPSRYFAQRTEWNVRDADATVIFSIKPHLSGGSRKTRDFALHYRKPHLHLSRQRDGAEGATKLRRVLSKHKIAMLNVAGPRASEQPEVSDFVLQVLEQALAKRKRN